MDSYTDYSDSSAPRTPSPNDVHPYTHHKDNIVYPIYSNNSLLQELYDDPQQYNFQQSQDNWHRIPQNNDLRRATFPYVRHEREDPLPYNYNHTQRHHDVHPYHYSDRAAPLDRDGSYMSSNSPHSTYEDTGNIKIEDGAPLVVPSQSSFYRTANPNGSPPLNMPYISPHTGLPIQHTDDAASKETQYLRRRCFNCHTTEPPSWRRSTLNPGKIVCNKCGLYERTHLRPRPLRFDELRSGNKATRKQKVPSSGSPRQPKLGVVKKEPREFGLVRRSSVSSSSVSSSGASDWDDNGVLMFHPQAHPALLPVIAF